MSEDQLERALQQMKEEDIEAGALDTARTRVWENMTGTVNATCAEFRPDFPAYLARELGDSRRILVEDHLGRCPGCRARIAELKGGRTVVAMPRRSSSRRVQWAGLAAAAALLLSILYLGRGAIDRTMAPGGPRATVVSANGSLYRLPMGALQAGAEIGEHESLRTGPGAHAMLRLADGSVVDMNERTELFVTAAWSGQAIHLQRGDIIVKAAKQRRGHLRVLTRDSIASVKGTVFAVSAGMGGSVVSVVEGSVAVNQPGTEVLLSPGQQAASSPALASSVASAVAWSPEAESYLELLTSLGKIERELNFPAELRTTPTLLSYLPAGVVVYGTIPNPGVTIGRALSLAEEQSAQNAAFGAWWSSEAGQRLREMTDRIQTVNPLLGDEIVFCASLPGTGEAVPIVMAGVRPGKRVELSSALAGLFAAAGEAPPAYSVSDDLMIVSSSPSNLAWALAHLGQAAGSPFAAALVNRYQRGVGWLIGMDVSPVVKMASGDDAPSTELAGMIGMKYVFLEQRAPAGGVENEVTFAFQGARSGMGSWLADAGSGGAAEYLPADVLVGAYVSTREPLQLFEEFAAQITRSDPNFERNMATMDEKLGTGFVQNLAGALGTEAGRGVQRGAWARRAGEADRARAGERERTHVEHDETWRTSDRHRLDVRSGLSGGRLRSRVCRARHCDPQRRLAPRLVARVPRPASLVRRTPPVGVRLAERERGPRNPVDSDLESENRRARSRARSDPRGVRWNTRTDSRVQSYSYLGSDHGRDAAREPWPGDCGTANGRHSSVTGLLGAD
jgi:hypothetical protein